MVARNPSAVLPLIPSSTREAAAMLTAHDHAILAMRIAGESPSAIATILGIPESALVGRTESIVAELARPIPNPACPALTAGRA